MALPYSDKQIVYATLRQIEGAICQILDWNKDITCADDYLVSPEGVKTLAATSMLIEAIGEGVKKIDHKTNGRFLIMRPEIPWRDVKHIRDFIAHGYFDIDSEQIFDVVTKDLTPLLTAIQALIDEITHP